MVFTGEDRGAPLCEIPCETMKSDFPCETLKSDRPFDTLTQPSNESTRKSIFASSQTLDLTGEGRGVPLGDVPCDTMKSNFPYDTLKSGCPCDTITSKRKPTLMSSLT